ncbi:hypothetical protein RRG08_031406 [Elysia crispata]|uniref:Uncharacterized protein n=1 Tax=Elysia crispata TaxID=231223 RepID=A0AAE1DJ44_9GAST|nr:hypothetical protein RRG08_031406 [Elysia crispata]
MCHLDQVMLSRLGGVDEVSDVSPISVSEFAQQMAVAHEAFSKEIQAIIATFRRRNYELKKQRPMETPNCIFSSWEALLQETEMDAQAHLDAASLLHKNVYLPLQEVASHKNRQADMLALFRDNLDSVYIEALREEQKAEKDYHSSFQDFVGLPKDPGEKEGEAVRGRLHRTHNDYILNIRATNTMADEYNKALPRILEEMEEIYIDTGNTINVAVQSHALLLLTKAKEQHKRYEGQLRLCRQVSPHSDVTFFVKAVGQDNTTLTFARPHQDFKPAVALAADDQKSLCRQMILDRLTEESVLRKRSSLQAKAMEMAVSLKHSQDIISTLSNVCQRIVSLCCQVSGQNEQFVNPDLISFVANRQPYLLRLGANVQHVD